MSSVKVAVRVRPFNKREIDLQCKNIIHMVDNKTIIQNPKCNNGEEDHEFTFDHSYWSFRTEDVNFASQSLVFDHLGKDIVSDAIEGYNSCIFAYGQTGSGKTHTMMGDGSSEGLIPRICQWLFQQMTLLEKNNDAVSYKTEISYLEIYNEQVRDLLDSSQDNNGNYRRSMKVREHPKYGPYVEKLSKHKVYNYEEIFELMQLGNTNRTTASTNMNDTSSRSHAIFTIMFSKASYIANNPYETISKINLVDLAGSERANATNAQGQRLVEGSHINKSLVTLGSVISTLAQNSKKNNKKKLFIPYRDSILTWLLKDSLGGNSKTVMVATISPACVNFPETLNTLRYANRAKNILNKPHINEDTNTKLIRDLRMEIERLNSMLKQDPLLCEKVQENEAKVKELTEEWMNKWDDIKSILKEQHFIAIRKSGNFGLVLDSDRPHLIVCVDDDVLSTGVTLYHLNEGDTFIGTKCATKHQDITISNGPDVEDEHCSIHWNVSDNVVTLHPINNALCFVNNSQVEGPTVLHQGCFIVFGENMYRFSNPLEVKSLKEKSRDNNTNQVDISLLNRSSRLINSTSYDSMYNSINSLNKKALMSSFASTQGLSTNDEESETSKDSSSDFEPNRPDNFALVQEELDFIKSFLVELQKVITCENEQSNRNIIESFLQIVIKIGKEEQFSKDRILQILSFINNLDLAGMKSSDVVAVQRVADYLLEKLNGLKSRLNSEMKLDYLNNNEATSNSTNDSISSELEHSLSQNSELPVTLSDVTLNSNDSTYGYLCQLSSELDSNFALLHECVSRLSESQPVHHSDHVSPSNIDSQSTLTFVSSNDYEDMIENEVQRRLEMHLQKELKKHNSMADVSVKPELGLASKEVPYSSQSLNMVRKDHNSLTKQRSLSLTYDELDQILIYVPSFHLLSHPDQHYEYEIKIGINGDNWTIYRRYRCFLQLHKFIRVQYGNQIKLPYFPPKKWSNMSEKVIENRRRFLENYLQKVIDLCKILPECPLNFRARGLEHLNRLSLYNFNSFFQINPLVDKEDLR